MAIIGYARVSTLDQDHGLQINDLEKAGCSEIVVETASGGDDGRPALNELLDRLGAGDTLVVWKLDRLARSTVKVIETINRCKTQGFNLRIIGMNIDTATPTGKFFLTIMGSFAELERELIRERTRAGLEQAKRRGKKLGRKRVMLPHDVAEARRLLAAGNVSVRQVARACGVGKSTLYRYVPEGKGGLLK